MRSNNTTNAFFALVRAGLWERDVCLSQYGVVDYEAVLRLAEEQSVVGLVAAGLEHITDIKVPKDITLQFVAQALQLEQRNTAMNHFINVFSDKLKEEGFNILIVKGQGIAQCYERPLWRASGDIDLLIDFKAYEKARDFLLGLADSFDVEVLKIKHQAMTFGPWEVELHGTLRGLWSPKVDKTVDTLQNKCFENTSFRDWNNNGTIILLPSVDYDLIFVFAHILQHFFRGGLSFRQVCDWVRLIWQYRESIDSSLLENRLHSMGIVTEWKAFASLAVDYLGLPAERMPFYSSSNKWHSKAKNILNIILEDSINGYAGVECSKSLITQKMRSFYNHTQDLFQHIRVFPIDSVRIWVGMLFNGLKVFIKGEHFSYAQNRNFKKKEDLAHE